MWQAGRQAGTAMWELTQEFEWPTRDAGMANKNAKVHLVSVLNQDTFSS